MFPSFTGSSRRPRNINLSGRKSTPAPPRGPLLSRVQVSSSSVINAQQERAQREAERRRLKAATTIQRVWRGRKEAEAQRGRWRKEWDDKFAGGGTGKDSIDWDDLNKWVGERVGLFLAFYERGLRSEKLRRRDTQDLERMRTLVLYMVQRVVEGADNSSLRSMTRGEDGRPRALLEKFAKLLIEVLDNKIIVGDALQLLPVLATLLPDIVDPEYYRALSQVTVSSDVSSEAILRSVLTPFHHASKMSERSYAEVSRYYAANYLITPGLPDRLGRDSFELLRSGVEAGKLVNAMAEYPETWTAVPVEGRLWMLSYMIHFFPKVSGGKVFIDLTDNKSLADKDIEERSYIQVLSLLLSSVAAEAGKRIDVEDVSMENEDKNEDDEDEDLAGGKSDGKAQQPLPPFVKSELRSLVEQSAVTSIFSHASFYASDHDLAKILAGFALTLLMVFPAKSREIRMWLCLAETNDSVSAVRYLWDAVKRSQLFHTIKKGFSGAVGSLKRRNSSNGTSGLSPRGHDDDEWNFILLFVELYGFLLLVMDDDEFFAGGRDEGKARQLPLKEVGELSLFLKNLAFAMYWSGGEIMGEDKKSRDVGEVSLGGRASQVWDVGYLRGVATSLLRMIYTRDSRRRFLPVDHWLMTSLFDIESFIPAVVQEEENRHQIETDDPDDVEEPGREYDVAAVGALSPYERRNLHLERLKKSQRRQQRKHYLATITPRLEILQNLPFFIPFATRVRVFREFVAVDQRRRRGGFVDPDQWRAAVLSRSSRLPFPTQGAMGEARENLNKHHATIRRNRAFEDAYEQFWPLGEGLKEPIQITFVDKFGAEEAGIDGGGVTKEFLTGVCGDAFTPSAFAEGGKEGGGGGLVELFDDEDGEDVAARFGKNLFLENEHHLLYPNPTSVEELKEEIRRTRGPYQDLINQEVKALLKRYEFLGRILGKCLYEGILVDVAFAPFFLLMWSQQASDSKTSTAAGVNDLRDLDQDLYRGLVKLKNYAGDVEYDFGLNFTISSRLPKHDKTLTVELKPNGEKTLVTNANRLEYIHLVSRYRLSMQAYSQTSAFLKGLNSIINPNWLSMFNQSELQTLVGGEINTPIDVEDLRKNTIYGGIYQVGDDGVEHESVQLFWQVMRGLGDEDRRKVLRFVTSVARAPLLGFGVLRPRFSIRDAGEDQGRLCSASTCVNLLKLPRYKDPKILREKLLYSVNSNAGFDLS